MAAEAEIKIGVDTDNAERNIAAFQGAIDVLGGSLEVAVGGLALFGVNEEQIEGIESAALGAIAFADGSKRLADGLVALAQNTNIASKAQAAFNAIANLNPYILAGTAIVATIAAVGAAYALLSDEVDGTAEAIDNLNESLGELGAESAKVSGYAAQLEALKDAAFPDDTGDLPKNVTDAINLYADLLEAFEASKAREQELRDDAAAVENEQFQQRFRNFQFWEDEKLEEFRKTYEKQLEEDEDNEFARQSLAAIQAVQRINEEQEVQFRLEELVSDAYSTRERIIKDYYDSIEKVVETRGADIVALEKKQATELNVEVNRTLQTGGAIVSDNLEEQTLTRFQMYSKSLDKFREETAESTSELAKMLTQDILKAASFASDLITIFEKDGEERAERQFELAKKVNISLALINGAAAITEVLKDPSIPTTIGKVAAAAGIAATTAAQIATINRTEFGGGGDLSVDGVDGVSTGAGQLAEFSEFGLEQLQRQQQQIGGIGPGTPIQAYVVAGDVQNGLEADQQIQTRRTL